MAACGADRRPTPLLWTAPPGPGVHEAIRAYPCGMGKTKILDYSLALSRRVTEEQEKAWSAGTPAVWANESHAAAVEHAYKDVPEGQVTRLPESYVADNRAAIEQQLQ